MFSFIQRNWFLVALLILLPLGIALGRHDSVPALARAVRQLPTPLCTGGILFLMSITLDTGKLVQSLRRPFPVVTACTVNMLLLPLLCLPLLSMQLTPDFRVGLLIAACVPCTMAAASVWTRKAGGNDAVSLLVTLITNGSCFMITPAWMELGRVAFGTADTSDAVSFTDMMFRLVLGALLPAILGQVCRMNTSVRIWVDNNKSLISNLAQSIILTLVFVSSFKGGQEFDFDGTGVCRMKPYLSCGEAASSCIWRQRCWRGGPAACFDLQKQIGERSSSRAVKRHCQLGYLLRKPPGCRFRSFPCCCFMVRNCL